MIDAIIKNLEKGKYLLENITDEQYSNTSIAPYYSSIGGHIRHVLDVFSCVFIGMELNKKIDLTKRERNTKAETYTAHGLNYMNQIINKLNQLKTIDLKQEVLIVDDLGNGCCTVQSTLEGMLLQAQSHTTHHFATIGYMLHALNITLPVDNFGVNPTTPKELLLKDK